MGFYHIAKGMLALMPLLLIGSFAGAQKYEVERRVDVEEFPASAVEDLQEAFPEKKKVKYYKETSQQGESYEAKFEWKEYRYSVEFDPEGDLQDIEREVRYRDLPDPVRRQMEAQWTDDFRRHRVNRTQEQVVDERLRYEIIVRGKDANGVSYFEYLFEDDGAFVKRQKIVLPPNDIILY
jgi:hypothetical protein